MDNTRTISISEARQSLFDIDDEIGKYGTQYYLTSYGKWTSVILSAEEYVSLTETLCVIRDFPTLKKDVLNAREELKSKKTISLSKVKQLISKPDVHNRVFKQSSKKSTKNTKKVSR